MTGAAMALLAAVGALAALIGPLQACVPVLLVVTVGGGWWLEGRR